MKNRILKPAFLAVLIGLSTMNSYADTPADNTAATQVAQANPFGLVYHGAITRNEAGKVNIHPVQYHINGIDIAANVYTPAQYDPNKQYPAIVVAHPNGGVKEQVAGLYAQNLAQQGYIAIAFDAGMTEAQIAALPFEMYREGYEYYARSHFHPIRKPIPPSAAWQI
ncbi:alpha/beta hydrolase [Uruburuella testudinis]|uniref:Alpha/beta hydrolase n=1 Tax=Uruburuella testudinis TaxID=1282863 RepID=A0ABY4DVF6_9NEIS|nr:alpha/beta hydrolase [Uruburuella testudinis]UOO83026.1 alpha/beta hydrolase [Uruburuella testudinis]